MSTLKSKRVLPRANSSTLRLIAVTAAVSFILAYGFTILMTSLSHNRTALETRVLGINSRHAALKVYKNLTSDMVFGRSKLRGFHREKGILPLSHICPAMFPARSLVYERWMQRCKQGKCDEHLSVPYPTCKIFINHYYKFIWIRETKVGGTALREPLGWICGDNFAVEGLEINAEKCSVPLFTNATAEDVEKWWREYFVFSIVRNPYIRFASGEEYIRPKVRGSCNKTMTFGEVCIKPFAHTQYCLNHECCKKDVEHHYLHIADQSTCILDTNMNPAVDYLGETETLDEDVKIIINEINQRRDPSLPPLKAFLNKRNTRNLKMDADYIMDLYRQNEFCLNSIGTFFQRDFKLLGYETFEKLPE